MFRREARGMMLLAIIMPLAGLLMALLLPPLLHLVGVEQAPPATHGSAYRG